MPTRSNRFLKEKVRTLPQTPGVYLMRDRLGRILYVGKAKNLKKRVSTYFQASRRFQAEQPKIAAMIKLIHDIEIITVKSDTEAILLEGRLIKEWKPKYNTEFTDDKRFLLIRVDIQNPLPSFRLVRNRRDDGARYFGPFAHSGVLRTTLSSMRQQFGIILNDTNPVKINDDSYRLYNDIRAEIYGHPNEVTSEDYKERVANACTFLEGKGREWLEELKVKMYEASENKNYEKAAKLRDIANSLKATITPARRFTGPLLNIQSKQTLEELRQHLKLSKNPGIIECFDISHISGTFVVASLIRFKNGKPDKKSYRRYQIRSFIGNDDYKAMEEVVSRRYCRLQKENKPFPDLIIIDGGAGQVKAALNAFVKNNLKTPFLIGLAKKQELIIFADDRPPLKLPEHISALRLLQQARDEAHRFANTYNADLRSRKLRESVLDNLHGLGEKRKQALLRKFKSIERLRKASIEELSQIEGIGPKLSKELVTFLKKG